MHSFKYNHGEHNEKVCDYLMKSGEFNDWVITTAYYSCLQFVEHFLFPGSFDLGSGAKSYSCFDVYYRDLIGGESKHGAFLDLVEEYFEEVADDFKTLKDNCWTARYRNYQMSPEQAQLSRDCLANIKELCTV